MISITYYFRKKSDNFYINIIIKKIENDGIGTIRG